ncbi:MAG: DUF4920 domain-containing protein [Myxococcota bacterium]
MKLVTVIVAGALALGGMACGKQAETPKPADNVQVSAKPEAVKAEAAKPEAAKAEAKPEATALAASGEPAGEHAGCGDHAMAAAMPAGEAGEADCPFAAERKADMAAGHEGCADKMAEAGEPMPGALPAPGQAQLLGSPFTLTEAKPLGEVVKTASAEKDDVVRISGTVDQVCQKRGCWMVVRDGDVEARVIMKDHAFAIPFDSKGLKATVEGTLKVKVYTEAQAKHLAEDGAQDPAKVSGEKKEFLVTATTVQLGG